MVQDRVPVLLLGSMNMGLDDLRLTGAWGLLQSGINEPINIEGSRVSHQPSCYLFAGYENEVLTHVSWHLHSLRIYELIVLRENEEIVSPIMVPFGDSFRRSICMAAQDCVGVSVAFIPYFLRATGYHKRSRKHQRRFPKPKLKLH